MKIALINENSQANKNKIIFNSLDKICKKYNYDLINYGMVDDNDNPLTYVQIGLMASIILNSGAVDFVVTGCGTGQGAMLACNSFPGVFCGLVVDPTDAFMFSQINAGNAISIPFAKGFGWGSELTLENIFNELFKKEFGGGYPKERSVPEKENREILDNLKKITTVDLVSVLNSINKEFLKNTINRECFKTNFFKDSKNNEINDFLKQILD